MKIINTRTSPRPPRHLSELEAGTVFEFTTIEDGSLLGPCLFMVTHADLSICGYKRGTNGRRGFVALESGILYEAMSETDRIVRVLDAELTVSEWSAS